MSFEAIAQTSWQRGVLLGKSVIRDYNRFMFEHEEGQNFLLALISVEMSTLAQLVLSL